MKAIKIIFFSLWLIACSAPQSEAQTVYITKTGAKYHVSSCQYLRKSKIAITMDDAVARGYDPCSVCEPGSPSKKNTSSTTGNTNNKPATTGGNSKSSGTQKSVQCSAITKAGARCSRMTTDPSGKCYQHK